MKIIIRADDLGISEGVNYGILKSIKDGVVTSTGIMPNMKYAEHGYNLVKDTGVCIGQHTNISLGRPLMRPDLIPSLVNEKGDFYSSSEINQRKVDSISISECELEIEAQLNRFIEITGKKPDYFEGHAVFSKNYFKALENVAKRYGLFYDIPGFNKEWEKEYGITSLGFVKLNEEGLYDAYKYFEDNLETMKKEECTIVIFHPGYLDQFILDNSSYTKIRPMECEFLCSEWVKEFLYKNNIKLVDFRNYRN
ncbi:MAG: ChbG/HpnK family deacetylase [Clostridium sp.]|uniref:ChbG/HpnK family deacetylase n=1 Tax=Clostridium sp. TaxID=1506 RepID=UPI001DB564BB|nr:ChbG/HpnK family deacetylase [Clostridium sp.]MBS5928199.1 ChbG/HpnK family deacetylase [Clostridium sp.]MBS5987979.1 ChbG/HpnK family deacetylase [Clostridium sp.]